MKYLYIRQNINNPEIIIVGDESSIGGRDKAYTHKGGSLTIQYPRVKDDIELGKHGYNRDYQVHEFIKENCYDIVEYLSKAECKKYDIRTSEGFRCIGDPETCINELYKRIIEEVNKSKIASRWNVLAGPQDEASTALFDFIQSEEKEFLLNAFCRMGKTFTVLYTFTEGSEYNSAMFISGKSEAIRECRQTPYKCSNFDNVKVLDFDEYDQLVELKCLPSRWIIADTCQQLQRRNKSGKEIPEVDMIFFDECHFYNTTNVSDIISNKYKKIVYMSATPENLLATGDFVPEKKNIYEFTLPDLYKALDNGTLSTDDYILPRMFVSNLESYIKNLQEETTIKESTINYLNDCLNNNGFSFSSFFELTKSKKPTFIHEDEVNLFARALVNFLKSAGNKINYEEKLLNFMIFMPQQISKTELFADMLKQHLSEKDRVFTMVGNNEDEDGNGSSNDTRLSQIRSSMNRKEGLTIVLSYQKLGTGCTIKELQSVMFLNDTENASRILQNLSRCLTVDGNKKYGVIFEMNQSRAIIDRFKIITSKYGKFLPEEQAKFIFGETVGLMPINLITEYGDVEEVELNYDEAFMSYRKLDGACNLFDLSEANDLEELINALKGIDKVSGITASLTSKQETIKKAANVIKRVKSKSSSKKEVNKITDQVIKEKLLALSNYLKTSWYNSNADSFNEYCLFYEDEENAEDFEYTTSLTFKTFKEVIFPVLKEELFSRICKAFSQTATQKDLKRANGAIFTSNIF